MQPPVLLLDAAAVLDADDDEADVEDEAATVETAVEACAVDAATLAAPPSPPAPPVPPAPSSASPVGVDSAHPITTTTSAHTSRMLKASNLDPTRIRARIHLDT